MRVVIAGHETCGLINDLASEFRRRGNVVVTIAKSNQFFPSAYDFDLYDFPVDYLSRRFGAKWFWRKALQALWEVQPDAHRRLESSLRLKALEGTDLFIQVWAGIPFEADVLRSLKTTSARVMTFFMGSDVRLARAFQQEFRPAREVEGATVSLPDEQQKLAAIRTHERHSDAIFSVPDQMGLSLRPYHHLQIPLNLDLLSFCIPGRDVPLVVHAPSSPEAKGTDRIEAAISRLQDEGVAFEFASIRNQPHEQVLKLLSDADVLVDELVYHGPGWLSFEAMGSGCAVATRYLETSPPCFRPPVLPIDETNIVDQLRSLLCNREMRIRLAEEGRRYVEENNDIRKVVDGMLNRIARAGDVDTDYTPNFLVERYVPADAAEAALISRANEAVSAEPWYEAGVAGRSHDGIHF